MCPILARSFSLIDRFQIFFYVIFDNAPKFAKIISLKGIRFGKPSKFDAEIKSDPLSIWLTLFRRSLGW